MTEIRWTLKKCSGSYIKEAQRRSRFFEAHIKIKELVKCVVSSGVNILKAACANFERSLVLISYTLSGVECYGWHTHTSIQTGSDTQWVRNYHYSVTLRMHHITRTKHQVIECRYQRCFGLFSINSCKCQVQISYKRALIKYLYNTSSWHCF